MVKNSKYLLSLIILFLGFGLHGQGAFSPIDRDMEITRITLENFLKKWEGEPLLNRIAKTEASHQKGEGVIFKIEAPNADIFMNTQGGMFKSGDQEMMDTFYTDEIVSLQQQRLTEAVAKFVMDFYSYMPLLQDSERFKVVFEVKDAEKKKDGEVVPPSPKSKVRTYQLIASWEMKDLNDLKNGKLKANQFSKKITIEKE